MNRPTLDYAGIAELIKKIRLVVFDFDGVFTDNTVFVDQNGVESVRCWRSDGLGLRKLAGLGIESMILSTETNPIVSVRSKKLKIKCVQGCDDKRASLDRVVREAGIQLEEVCFVGNDINDLDCLRAVGLAVIVQDAHPDVWEAAHFRTQTPGGRGAVREVCDLFATVRSAS